MFVFGMKSGTVWKGGYSDFARHSAAFNIQNMNAVIPLSSLSFFFLHREYLNLPKQVDFSFERSTGITYKNCWNKAYWKM